MGRDRGRGAQQLPATDEREKREADGWAWILWNEGPESLLQKKAFQAFNFELFPFATSKVFDKLTLFATFEPCFLHSLFLRGN